jgi:hypothetical protein
MDGSSRATDGIIKVMERIKKATDGIIKVMDGSSKATDKITLRKGSVGGTFGEDVYIVVS